MSNKTILYVEDHPPAQLLMQAIISDLTPHHLVLAQNGAEAQRITAEVHPDLYILDLDLPDTDGLVLAKTLHALHPAPIILVSAYAEAFTASEHAALISAYLPKPLDPDHVAATLQRTLS